MRSGSNVRFVVGLVVLVAGPLAGQPPRVHPAAEYVTPSKVTYDVAFAVTSAVPIPRQPQPSAVIGSMDGSDATVFGRIVSSTYVDDTTIALIDASTKNVRLFTTSGRHLQTFGREGSGPGEFRAPTVVIASPSGEILVADMRRTVQFFRRGPRGFEYHRTWTLPVGVRSMCYLGSRLYVNGMDFEGAGIIRSLDDSGKVTSVFGTIYKSPNAMINYQVSEGRIVCDQGRGLIYYMTGSLLGDVRAFRPTGDLVWRVRVSDYLVNKVTEGPNGGVSVTRSPAGGHTAGSLVLLDPAGLVAQWQFLSPEQMKAREAPTRTHSVLIDPATGKPTSVGTGLPLLTSRRGEFVMEQTDDPIPQLTLRRYPLARPGGR